MVFIAITFDANLLRTCLCTFLNGLMPLSVAFRVMFHLVVEYCPIKEEVITEALMVKQVFHKFLKIAIVWTLLKFKVSTILKK